MGEMHWIFVNTAQTLINVHLKEELDEEYTIKINY